MYQIIETQRHVTSSVSEEISCNKESQTYCLFNIYPIISIVCKIERDRKFCLFRFGLMLLNRDLFKLLFLDLIFIFHFALNKLNKKESSKHVYYV